MNNSMTLRALLDDAIRHKPRVTAMRYYRDGRWQSCSYAELGVRVTTAAEVVAHFRVEPGSEHVAMLLENMPEWVTIYLANAAAGVAVVPIDPKLRAREVEYVLRDSQAVLLFAQQQHRELLAQIVEKLPRLRAIIFVDGAPPLKELGGCPCFDYRALLTHADNTVPTWFANHRPAPHDVASLIYTSGTTGAPKGAMLTHLNFCADVQGALEAVGVGISHRDTFFVVLPLFHSFSFTTNLVLVLACCGTMAFAQNLRTLAADLQALRPTIFFAVPLLVEKLYAKMEARLKANRLARVLLRCGLGVVVGARARKGFGGRLRFLVVGGAPTPVQMIKDLRRLGIPIVEGYGLTECAPVVAIPNLRKPRIGTIGPKLPNIAVRIANPNAQGVGELQVRGPVVMKGYYKNSVATQEAFDEEWLRTGDLASVDRQGYLMIRGRSKALIVNREGKNIYPEEVEGVITGDPSILDILVVGYTQGGVPGERVGALVTPNLEYITAAHNGREPEWASIESLLRQRVKERSQALADYKHPRKIVVQRAPLERTSTQKVRRHIYQGQLNEA